MPRRRSTRVSMSPSASASTRARPIRWSAARSRCRKARARTFALRVRHGRRRPGGARRRRRHRRRRRSGRRHPKGHHELRLGHRHARHDAAGRQARPRAGPSRPDAQPEDRHRHPRRRARAVAEFKGGKVEYRTDRYGNVHVTIGKASFEPAALETNFRAVLDELQRAKPAAAKGRYLKKISVSSTMGPGIKVDTNRLRPEVGHPDHRP